MMEFVLTAVVMGTGATVLIDAWALARKELFGIRGMDFSLVGRWFTHLAQGRFHHARISDAEPVAGERVIGWVAHYAIGIVFAAFVPVIWGMEWTRDPTPGPALTVGIISVAAPFFIMQPGMGLGVAARLAPHPMSARLQTLLTHSIYGLGLYLAAELLQLFSSY